MCGQVPPKGSRRHGLQTPLQPYQILVWGVIASSILLFFFLCVPFIANDTQRGIYTGLYILLIVVGLTAFFFVSLTDPALKNGTLAAGEGVFSKSCTTCGSTMTPSTKHCYHCHKCVEGFDHHCLYLNTCIGTYNYTSFYLLISCLSTLVFLQSCVIALLLATYDTPEVATNTQWTVLSPKAYMILLAATAFIPMGGFLLVLSLLGFHAWIICWGITTYNWILERRQKTQATQDSKAANKFAKLQAQEQKALITREGQKTVIVEPTANGGTSTTTITSRPISSAPTNTLSVSPFPLHANSLLSDSAPPSTTKPASMTKSIEMTPLSVHTPSPSSPPPPVASASTSAVTIHVSDNQVNAYTPSLTAVNSVSSNSGVNKNDTPSVSNNVNISNSLVNTRNNQASNNSNSSLSGSVADSNESILLRPSANTSSTASPFINTPSPAVPVVAPDASTFAVPSRVLSSHAPSHTSALPSLSSDASAPSLASSPAPKGVTVVEITPNALVRRTSTSVRREALPDPDLEDESNALIDHRAVGEDHRASVSVERPLSYLGVDLGEKPQRRLSRTDSTQQDWL